MNFNHNFKLYAVIFHNQLIKITRYRSQFLDLVHVAPFYDFLNDAILAHQSKRNKTSEISNVSFFFFLAQVSFLHMHCRE